MTPPYPSIPDSAPIMVLPGALLFPYALLPLRIFEPRYRAMLDWALENERMFCVALMKPGITEAHSTCDFFQIAGLGLIRACVKAEDGTSHLMLQGMARVRFGKFIQDAPFRSATITPVESIPADPSESAGLADEIRTLCTQFQSEGFQLPERVEDFLASMKDPDMLVDSVAHSFIRDPFARQQLLEESSVSRRLRLTIHHLNSQLNA